MPTARELLEEVDALMRRNRPGSERTPAQEALVAAPDDDIPVLTDVAPPAADPVAESPAIDGANDPAAVHVPGIDGTPPVSTPDAAADEAALDAALEADTLLDDVPLLTDAVDLGGIDAPGMGGIAAGATDLGSVDAGAIPAVQAPAADDEERVLVGGLPADAFGVVAASLAAHTVSPPQEQSRLAADDPRWTTLAEEIGMQVLQRVDLFTERGLSDRLQPHLQGIVERASAELVATINAQVGQVLRAYVAEAIEREIEKWREEAR